MQLFWLSLQVTPVAAHGLTQFSEVHYKNRLPDKRYLLTVVTVKTAALYDVIYTFS